jgi:hypothetical protein
MGSELIFPSEEQLRKEREFVEKMLTLTELADKSDLCKKVGDWLMTTHDGKGLPPEYNELLRENNLGHPSLRLIEEGYILPITLWSAIVHAPQLRDALEVRPLLDAFKVDTERRDIFGLLTIALIQEHFYPDQQHPEDPWESLKDDLNNTPDIYNLDTLIASHWLFGLRGLSEIKYILPEEIANRFSQIARELKEVLSEAEIRLDSCSFDTSKNVWTSSKIRNVLTGICLLLAATGYHADAEEIIGTGEDEIVRDTIYHARVARANKPEEVLEAYGALPKSMQTVDRYREGVNMLLGMGAFEEVEVLTGQVTQRVEALKRKSDDYNGILLWKEVQLTCLRMYFLTRDDKYRVIFIRNSKIYDVTTNFLRQQISNVRSSWGQSYSWRRMRNVQETRPFFPNEGEEIPDDPHGLMQYLFNIVNLIEDNDLRTKCAATAVVLLIDALRVQRQQ